MGKSTPSPPPVPDPVATAAAQTTSNLETARTTAALNRVDQYGPDGQATYAQPDPNNPDHYTQTTTLSPQMQAIFDATRRGQQTYVDAAGNQLTNASASLSTPYSNPGASASLKATDAALGATQQAQRAAAVPVNTDYNSVRQQAIDAANSRLRPEQQMQEETLRSRLLNSGITEGSQAWNNAYRQFNNSNNDAQQQTILNAENLAGQSIGQTAQLRQIPLTEAGQVANLAGQTSNVAGAGEQQSMAAYNEPLNVASSVLTGQQVNMPQFTGVPQSQVAPTDVIGATMGSANLANQQYAQRLQANSAATGGLYSLGGMLGAAAIMSSDRRMKQDVHRVGKTDAGTPIYTYKYKGDPSRMTRMGVMAQELMKKQPGAVQKAPTGFFAVDYAKVH